MYILFVPRGFSFPEEPMWGNFETDQARELSRLGHKIVVMSVDRRFRLYWRKLGITHRVEKNIDIYNLFLCPLPHQIFPSLTLWIAKKLALYLYKKVEKEQGRPDIIYAHYLTNIAISVDIKKKHGIPLVGIEHWSKLNADQLPYFVSLNGKKAYPHTDALISVSKTLSKRIYQHFGIESVVVNNMVDTSTFVFNSLKSKEKDFIFTSVGRLDKAKGFDVLIRAFKLAGFNEHVKLNIIGNGDKKNLQCLIDNLNLRNQISLLGFMNREAITKEFQKSQAFTLASYGETFGVAYIEAMLMGLPVIATLCGGPEEFVDETNGLLVPIGDEKALAEALKSMFSNINHYDRNFISQSCRNKFSPKAILYKLEKIFSEVLKK